MSTSDALRVQQELLQAAQRQIHGTGHAVDTSTFDGFANSTAYRNIIVELPSPSKAAKKAHTAARNTYTIGVPKPSPLPTPSASSLKPVPMPSPMASSPLASSPLASSPSSSASPSAFTFSPKHIRSAAQNMLSPGQQTQQPDLVSPRRAVTDPKTAALINRPQRVEPPAEMHAPSRRDPWSSLALSATPGAVPASPVALTVSHSATVAQNERQQLTDLALLATACHRGGRVRGEAFNYFCMGILHDNLSENLKAIGCYQKFAKLCEMSNDRAGLLLSYNAMGVSYQALGPEYYGDALQFHEQHVESPDLHDKFVAHTNMGLIFASCQQQSEAAAHHQHALRYAIRLGSVASQSIAIGNLGLTGTAQKDHVTAKACMERYLELSSAMNDPKAQSNAHATLGQIATEEGEYKTGVQHFHLALRTAQSNGDRALAATSKVNLGVALGNTMMDDHMRKMAALLADSKHHA